MSPAGTSSAAALMQPLLQSTAEAVQWNCDLLNAVIGRINTIESWTKIAELHISKAMEFISEASPKLAELDGFGPQIRSIFAKLEEVAWQADVRLRTQIAQMITGIAHRQAPFASRRAGVIHGCLTSCTLACARP